MECNLGGQPLKEFLVSAGFGADRSKNSWSQLDVGSIAQSCWSQLVWARHHGRGRSSGGSRCSFGCPRFKSNMRAQSWCGRVVARRSCGVSPKVSSSSHSSISLSPCIAMWSRASCIASVGLAATRGLLFEQHDPMLRANEAVRGTVGNRRWELPDRCLPRESNG